ncbi:hypothetical protein SipoB123_24595 [Streptomyces ipomoeae]|nr:hypothetical protein SipoB123_24595 [Streptomyces ipomoeae]
MQRSRRSITCLPEPGRPAESRAWRPKLFSGSSKRNRIYQAYRELGRVMRTTVLLRFLSEPELRESIQAMTNKVEAFHKFSHWLMFASDVLQDNDRTIRRRSSSSTSCWRTASFSYRGGHHEGRQPAHRRGLGGGPGDRHPVHHEQDPPLRNLAPGHRAAREPGGGTPADGRLMMATR